MIWHPHQVGYGGNQKTCYMQALHHDADVVVMLHPDGQYEPSLIPRMIQPILDGEADLVLGSRLAEPGMARAGGMPLYKYLANRALTAIENRVLGTLQASHMGFRISEVPARTLYFDDASSISLKPSTVHGLKTLWAAFRLILHRRGIVRSRKFMP